MRDERWEITNNTGGLGLETTEEYSVLIPYAGVVFNAWWRKTCAGSGLSLFC